MHLSLVSVNSLMCSMMKCRFTSLHDMIWDACWLLQKAVVRCLSWWLASVADLFVCLLSPFWVISHKAHLPNITFRYCMVACYYWGGDVDGVRGHLWEGVFVISGWLACWHMGPWMFPFLPIFKVHKVIFGSCSLSLSYKAKWQQGFTLPWLTDSWQLTTACIIQRRVYMSYYI